MGLIVLLWMCLHLFEVDFLVLVFAAQSRPVLLPVLVKFAPPLSLWFDLSILQVHAREVFCQEIQVRPLFLLHLPTNRKKRAS